jgi:DNA-binding beta-propeller fold protein YncE
MAKRVLVASLSAPLALAACHSSDDLSLSSDPPKSVEKVATGGFTSPMDAVASLDGKEFYFTAFDDMKQPALWKVASTAGATPEVLAAGDPLESPIGLVLSCDGDTLYTADIGGDGGAVLAVPTAGGALADLAVTGIVRPGGLAMGPDCSTLFATGRTEDGAPALFKISTAGGAASPVWIGDPLVSPTGLHVDDMGVAWVMDHRAVGSDGEGVLFAIPQDGSAANEVVSNLKMGTFGGVSLTAGGGTAVMPTLDADGHGQLTSVDIATGEKQQLAAPDILDPSGLRTARRAAVFAVVDSEGGAIYRAE